MDEFVAALPSALDRAFMIVWHRHNQNPIVNGRFRYQKDDVFEEMDEFVAEIMVIHRDDRVDEIIDERMMYYFMIMEEAEEAVADLMVVS